MIILQNKHNYDIAGHGLLTLLGIIEQTKVM